MKVLQTKTTGCHLPTIEFNGKKLLINGIDLSDGATEIHTSITVDGLPTATIKFICAKVNVISPDGLLIEPEKV